ncbi:hypothetical protein MMC31_006705 [Peltigera leucophlebia]|nr:hypothetical protein [Peltigera leucophlebia]
MSSRPNFFLAIQPTIRSGKIKIAALVSSDLPGFWVNLGISGTTWAMISVSGNGFQRPVTSNLDVDDTPQYLYRLDTHSINYENNTQKEQQISELSQMALLIPYNLQTLVLVLTLIAFIALLAHAHFNLNIHPLSCFPGPRLWACSRIPYVLHIQNGTLHKKIKALHDIYGPVVRVAPNELSFIAPEAWKNIYTDKPQGMERGEIYYGIYGQSRLFGMGHKDHARIRGAVSLAFRASAMTVYEENMRRYVHLLLEQLSLVVKNKARDGRPDRVSQDEVVDIVRWLNFTSFDIIGNLVYGGEPFGCLRRKEFHPWVELISNWVKTAAIFTSIRYYTPLDRVLVWLVPTSLIKQKEEFESLGRDRVRKRMLSADDEIDGEGVEDSKPSDLLSHLKLSNCEKIMTMAEMEAELHLVIIAGSETVATVLSGTLNYLCKNPTVLKTLANEVRSAVSVEADLTIANLSQLPYLTGVLKESLRIVSPTPISFPRIVPSKGASILGYWVPGHTVVAINSFAANHSDTNFYQPWSFLPERWLDPAATSPSSLFASDKRDAVKPFGGGSRECLGQLIAWTEMRLVLAGLVWAFDIEAVREVDWAQQKTYLVWQKRPFEVRLRRRVQV